jgi:hypothetical protein
MPEIVGRSRRPVLGTFKLIVTIKLVFRLAEGVAFYSVRHPGRVPSCNGVVDVHCRVSQQSIGTKLGVS